MYIISGFLSSTGNIVDTVSNTPEVDTIIFRKYMTGFSFED